MANAAQRQIVDPRKAQDPNPAKAEANAAEEETAMLSRRAVEVSRLYGGKLEVIPQVPIQGLQDFSHLYTPGIAEVSREIAKDPEKAFELTGRWNTIAIVTDGSRVLGLGNIGPEAALPVMEGKSLLFKYLGGVNAFPLPVNTKTPEELVDIVRRIVPSVGGINLEDIASPKCFYVLEQLQKSLPIPVWHDDQLGTAAATVAGLINALALTGREIWKTGIVLLGSGAANIATARLLKAMNADMGALTVVDHKGILHAEREDLDEMMLHNRWKYDLALTTNEASTKGGLKEALKGADVLLAASTPDPNTIKPEWIRGMAPRPIVFALANPKPEIWPDVAKAAGAAIVATGRSDFANQVNNSLIFPPVFRGILDARARGIPDDVVLVAAQELAKGASLRGLTEDHILPTMEEAEVFPKVAAAVAIKAEELGLARVHRSRAEYEANAERLMSRPKLLGKLLTESGLISLPEHKVKGEKVIR